ncbi:MAG TPA: helix-turn-helix domain-containing protein [Rhodanobacteraceae bacterium]|jgi:DNA-binding transcriptional ArsR family regulator|nr:helix-turn-helix domain-containing protein [Rhodanobacteraceae bacterium]
MDEPVSRYQLAEFGALLAEPARAAIVLALLDSRARPAGELAAIAGIGAPTASAHLKRLADAGLLDVVVQGRHRYFRLADDDVAHWIETLMLAAPRRLRARTPADRDLARARTCYRHLAGRLGVALFDRLRDARAIDLARDAVRVNRRGVSLLRDAGFPLDAKVDLARLDGRTCIDWTERRLHLSGALGTTLAESLIDARWLTRRAGTRALRMTARGRAGFAALGIEG